MNSYLIPILVVLHFSTITQSARILCYFPTPSISHQKFFQPIWRELSLRGHRVTVVTPDPLKDAALTNLTEIDVSFSYPTMRRLRVQQEWFALGKIAQYNYAMDTLYAVLDEQLSSREVRRLLNDESLAFDLVMVEGFFVPLYPLSVKYGAPLIGVMSCAALFHVHYSVANPTHWVLYMDIMQGYGKVETFWERLDSSIYNFMMDLTYYYRMLPIAQQLANKYFGDDTPDLYHLERNVSLQIVSANPILSYSRPNVPAMVEISNMHIKSPQPLPKDLLELLDESKEGIVYFSLGSNVKSVDLHDWQKEAIMAALSELPYRVLWKWEADTMEGKPENVIIKKWLPQQDLLAHPNVKVFITQGGLQSAEEAISNAVPMVAIPFFGDQPLNVARLTDAGIAIPLNKDTLTKEQLKDAIVEIATNPRYKRRAEEVRDILHDQPMGALEKAVYWIEYVIRHKGARHLRSPALDVPFHQYFLLDILGFVFGIVVLSLIVFSVVITYTMRIYRGRFNKEKLN